MEKPPVSFLMHCLEWMMGKRKRRERYLHVQLVPLFWLCCFASPERIPAFGKDQSGEDQCGARNGKGRDLFMQKQCGRNNGYNGDDINICSGFDRPNELYGCVPGHEAKGGSTEPQKEEMKQVCRLHQAGKLQLEIKEEQGGDHANQAVEDNAPCC